MKRYISDYLIWGLVILAVVALDQWTKQLAMQHLMPLKPKVLLPFLNLTLAFNEGAAFSFLSDASGWQTSFFIVLTTLILLALLVWLYRSEHVFTSLAVSLMIGGGLGNFIDRLRVGYVTDFIDAHLFEHHWPVFNLADTAVTIGVAFLLFDMLYLNRKNRKSL